MTVPELRVECKRLGLPCYQSKGRRLRKADLVRFLTNGFAESPRLPPRRPTVKAAPESSSAVETRHKVAYGTESPVISSSSPGTYQVEPGPPKRPQPGRCPARRLTDADLLVIQLAAMPMTPAESFALARVLGGTATKGHDGILRRREAKACQALADRARSERGRSKWHGRSLVATGVVSA